MHIALLYVDAGKGHITPARALSDAFQRLGHTTVVENLFATVGAPMINWISKYNWRLQLHFPKMETKVNAKSDTAANAKLVRYVTTHSHAVKDFQDWYEQVKPDLIVVPHFLAASIIQPLVDLLQLQVPVFEYAADVVFTPNLGINKNLDRLYICTEIGRELAIRAGQPEHTIRICPFPLKTELMQSKPLSKQDARKKLGLKDLFTVLLNLGGEGIGTADFLEEVARRNLNWQVITVGELSGSTKLHYKAFKENHPDFPLLTPGFVKNIQDYICACDVQAGKAGANALMESLFLQRPFLISSLLYAAWPTTIFFNRRNVGWVENDVTRQVDILQAYSEDPIQQEAMLQAFAKLPLVFDSDAFARQILDDAAEVRKTKFGIASV
jgi:processive 1,2-diacylglycerol beta-glucosyltransferase